MKHWSWLLALVLGAGCGWSTRAQEAPAVCPSERMAGMAMGDMAGMGSTDPMDAVALGDDLDGDGDPDELTICLQIVEIVQEIAPGVRVPVWVFAPDLGGMEPLARLPGPTLRVEQGDRVWIVVKNTHYFPHTFHMHGVIKPNAMDGVPDVTQPAIAPGEAFTYEFVAQNPGTHWYHCHVQAPIHLLMGMYGVIVIEPDRPANHVTPIVMGSRMPDLSVATQEAGYQAEYVLAYADMDPDLHAPLADPSLTPAELERRLHREYNTALRRPRYFVVNGRSFPYTLLDSQIVVHPDEHVLLRVLNVGARPLSLHLHGHHAEAVALDGTPIPPERRVALDTHTLTAGQRLDLDLNTAADGVHAAGPGVWLFHDHGEEALTTNGITPGGNIAYIVYEDHLDVYGLPKVAGDLSKYFAPSYYQGQDPVFEGAMYQGAPAAAPGGSAPNVPLWAYVLAAGLLGGLLGWALVWRIRAPRRHA